MTAGRPTNALVAALTYLSGAMPSSIVSAPRDEFPVPTTPAMGYCIVQAVPGGVRPNDAQVAVTYTLRCVAPDSTGALAVWDELAAALQNSIGEPIGNLSVTRHETGGDRTWWLYRGDVGSPGGPDVDPELHWPTLMAVATLVWSSTEV